ncbi:MAG: peptidylprolyl isomerase [Clostridiales bacterium]|nr:peptidylprolyl isomerase [Clostridiales bacterium]
MENKVLAKIDEFEITEKDLNDIINRYPEDKRGYFSTEEGKKALLEQTIGFELMNKLGEEIELNKTEEFKTEMENYAKDLLIRMTMNKVLSEVTITENDAEKYYNDNKDMFKEQPTVSAKHILVDSEEKAKEIKEEIDTNKISFEEAAKKYSSCPSKDQGGNLGVFGKGMMVPEFEEAAFNSELNVVSEPVKTQFGYHLIVVDAKNDSKVKEYDEVKDAILKQLNQQAQIKKYNEVLRELESKHKVERM